MKKVLSIVLVMLLMMSLASCSGPNAELTEDNVRATVDVAVTALKEFNADDLDTYVDSQTLSYIIGYAKEHQQFADLGKAIFKDLTVDVKSIDLQAKTVTIEVYNKDLSAVASSFTQKLLSQYSTMQLLHQLTDDGFLNTNLKELTDQISQAPLLQGKVEATLNIKQEKKNLVLSFDENAENAVSGGALGAIKNITK